MTIFRPSTSQCLYCVANSNLCPIILYMRRGFWPSSCTIAAAASSRTSGWLWQWHQPRQGSCVWFFWQTRWEDLTSSFSMSSCKTFGDDGRHPLLAFLKETRFWDCAWQGPKSCLGWPLAACSCPWWCWETHQINGYPFDLIVCLMEVLRTEGMAKWNWLIAIKCAFYECDRTVIFCRGWWIVVYSR